ncbi:MAG: pyridoxamine 5'-phosphate oxidase family protein [Pseudomonadota bacterium]
MMDDANDGFISDVAFTDAVKRAQRARGSRDMFQKRVEKRDWPDKISSDFAGFIAERDSFYLATASADGQPYIQHRGGPAGFLKVLDEKTLGFADYSGNRQYVSIGNLAENDRAHIFLMDYMHQKRVKVWGRLRAVEDDPDLVERLMPTGYQARPERAFLFTVTAWDVNCPQHIPRKFDMDLVKHQFDKMEAEIESLKAEVERLSRETRSDL